MNVKRYNINIDNQATEHIDGAWVKYEDLDVVISVVKSQVEALRSDLQTTIAEIETLRAIARKDS